MAGPHGACGASAPWRSALTPSPRAARRQWAAEERWGLPASRARGSPRHGGAGGSSLRAAASGQRRRTARSAAARPRLPLPERFPPPRRGGPGT